MLAIKGFTVDLQGDSKEFSCIANYDKKPLPVHFSGVTVLKTY